MKNPWMSLWMSAANRAAGTARGLWLAEARKQQRALAKDAAKSVGLGTGSRRKAGTKRRAK